MSQNNINAQKARSKWTDEMVKELVKIYGKERVAAIAARFGVTPNAVIGKAGRLGLHGRHQK